MDKASRLELYDRYVVTHKAPIFYQSWWLDTVCESGQWDAAVVQQDDQIMAIWPYFMKNKYGVTYLTTPTLTAYLGPWYEVPADITKSSSIQRYHKKMLTALASQLPTAQLIDTRWSPSMADWMPLTWQGYKQTTRYTYQLDLTLTEDHLYAAMSDTQRNTIKKARRHYNVVRSDDFDTFWMLNEASFRRQGEEVPYASAFMKKLYQALAERSAVDIFLSKHGDQIDGGVMTIYDEHSAYLVATGRADSDQGGAVSLAILEAVLVAKSRGCEVFDFEGSMIEGIASYFRSFGGELTPYNRVIKTSSKLWNLIFILLNRY